MKSSQSKYKVLYDKYSRDLKDRNKNAHKGNELATKGFCFYLFRHSLPSTFYAK